MDKNSNINEIFPLGEDKRCHISTDCTKTGLNNNIMVVGGSGSGKTTSVMMPIICNLENSNAVVVHTKRGIYDKTKKLLEEKGYNVLFVDLNDPTKSPYGYDPLLQCKSLTDVRNLAHTIAYCETSKTDPPREPFWLQNAENMTYIILRYVYEGYYSKGRTMKEALYLLDCLYYSDDRDLKEPPPTMKNFREGVFKFRDGTKENQLLDDERTMKKEYPLHYEMRKWYKYNKEIYRMWRRFLTLGDVTGGSVASSTMNPVNSMFTDEIRSLFNGKLPQFDARELLKPKTVAFIYVSPVNTAQHRFCSIMYQSAAFQATL